MIKYITLFMIMCSAAYSVELELKGSVTGKSGNTNSSAQLWDSTVKYKSTALHVGYNRDQQDHVTYSEAYKLHLTSEHKFSEKHGGYLKYEFYRDTFRGYIAQHKYEVGHLILWNEWFKSRLGYNYFEEVGHYTLGYIFNYEIFKSKLDYTKSLRDSLDYDISFDAGVRFKLHKHFSVEFKYEHIYKNQPIKIEMSRTDNKYYTMFVVNI